MEVQVCKSLSLILFVVFQQCPAQDQQKMICVQHTTSDGSLRLDTNTVRPVVKEGELLIKVKAVGINRLDLLQAVGKYPPPPGDSEILGVEVSGTVEELSASAASQCGLHKGDPVMALVGGGGYAEYCAAPCQTVAKIPEGVSFTEAAGIRSEEKLQACKQYGAHVAINYRQKNFAEEVLATTGNKGADVILDFVGASYWENHTQCIALDGRIISLGLLGGAVTEKPLNMGILLKKRVSLICSTLRSRSLEYKQRLIDEFSGRCLHLFADKSLKVPVDSVHSLEKASEAHAIMRTNKNIGKIILTV